MEKQHITDHSLICECHNLLSWFAQADQRTEVGDLYLATLIVLH